MQKNHASILSELLMCSTALGSGVLPPIDTLYADGCLMFLSAVSDEFKARMSRSYVDFNLLTSGEETALRRRVHQLEGDVASDTPGALDQLDDARKQLESTRYPFFHDYSSPKDMVLELAVKSRHKHMSIVDDKGFRLGMSLKHGPTFAREVTFLSMTKSYCMDQASIRVHGSGGQVTHRLSSTSTPPFSYVSSPPPDLAKKLVEKLSSTTILSPAKGYVAIVSDAPVDNASIDVTSEAIVNLLNTYYVIGHKSDDERASFEWGSPELEPKWRQFVEAKDALTLLGTPPERMDRAEKLLGNWHIKPRVAAAVASRAALCQAVLEHSKLDQANPLKITLRAAHLDLALDFFKVLFKEMMVRVQAGAALADNAAIARAARTNAIPAPARQEAAVEALINAIKESPNRMVSRDAAIRLPDISAALLDYIVTNRDTFVEITGRDLVNMGRTKRGYALKSDTSTDLGEALDDLEEARNTYAESPHDSMFDHMETVRHELMRLAVEIDRGPFGLPAVPITKMSSRQIRCLPAILADYPDCFVMRGTPDSPELPNLVKSVDDPEAPLDPGLPVVWVRRAVDGKDLRDWNLAAKLGFANTWGNT
jgi:hypothetical protein